MLIVPQADPNENMLYKHAKEVNVSLTAQEQKQGPKLLDKDQLINTLVEFFGHGPSFEVNRLRPKMDHATTMSIVICLIDWIKSNAAKRVDLSRFRMDPDDRKRIERLYETTSRTFDQAMKNVTEYSNAIQSLDPIIGHDKAFASLIGIVVGIIENNDNPVAIPNK